MERDNGYTLEEYIKRGYLYTAAEEKAVLRRAMIEDTWEAYAEAQFVEDHGSGADFLALSRQIKD